ncbi:MAG: AsnC family transcriptional regulator [Pseudomonadota bacterium]
MASLDTKGVYNVIDDLDKKIISQIQGDLPLDPRPFALLAERVGISEEAFVERVRAMKDLGIIRRFGATLYHQEAGFSSNAMVAWRVPEGKIAEVGAVMSRFREVTHCYQRRPQKDWQYNLYTMVHGDDRDQCYDIARRMSEKSGIRRYSLLFSEKEFKKTSMAYF